MKLLIFIGKIIGTKELLSSLDDVKDSTVKVIEDRLNENH